MVGSYSYFSGREEVLLLLYKLTVLPYYTLVRFFEAEAEMIRAEPRV